ncbi:hypothetical protein G7054_g4400 [Neopestalotiopsis clavispora]|nr:hypothetical protein G7054_g4400 [Neopestalotiopsis clavispora]
MHYSFFSYNLSRKYPFQWLTPLVIVGAIITIPLITFVNVTMTGYELVATSSNNPNQTVDNPTWYGGVQWPSYFIQNTQTACAAANIPLRSQVFTMNEAIPYSLNSVWRISDDGTKTNLGSLVYSNNILKDCNVTKVVMNILGRYGQGMGFSSIARVGIALETTAQCSVNIDTSKTDAVQGPTFFELVGSYDLVDTDVPRFLSRNKTDKASLYWGESLLHMYWMILSKAYFDGAAGTKTANDSTYSGVINLKRRSGSANATEDEVISDEFFSLSCFTEASYCKNNSISWLSQGNQDWDPYPGIWPSVNTLGKAMWFTVMTDLGRNESGIPNMLAYPDLLQNLSANLTNEVQYWNDRKAAQNGSTRGILMEIDKNLALTAFDPAQTPPPRLGASPATLSTSYICQVPKVKPVGTIIFSVLVADLVLLQAIWTVFKLIVDGIVQHKEPTLLHCSGCQQGSAVASMDNGGSYAGSDMAPTKYAKVAQREIL